MDLLFLDSLLIFLTNKLLKNRLKIQLEKIKLEKI